MDEPRRFKIEPHWDEHKIFRLHKPVKTTAIKRTAVRETCVSPYHGVPLKAPHEIPQTARQHGTEGSKGL